MWLRSKRLGQTPAKRDRNFVNFHGANRPNPATGFFLAFTVLAGLLECAVMVAVSVFYLPFYVLIRVLGKRPWTVTAHRVGTRKYRAWTVRAGQRADG